MRLTSPLTIVLLLGVAVVATLAIADALAGPTPRSCSTADTSSKQRLLPQAEREYRAILAAEPGSDCARKGMERLIVKLCHRADALLNGGALTAAKQAYVALLDEPSSGWEWVVPCALTGLAKIEKQEQRHKQKKPQPSTPCPCPTTCPTTCPQPGPDPTPDPWPPPSGGPRCETPVPHCPTGMEGS